MSSPEAVPPEAGGLEDKMGLLKPGAKTLAKLWALCLDSSYPKTLQQNQTTSELWREQDPWVFFIGRYTRGGHTHSLPLVSTYSLPGALHRAGGRAWYSIPESCYLLQFTNHGPRNK